MTAAFAAIFAVIWIVWASGYRQGRPPYHSVVLFDVVAIVLLYAYRAAQELRVKDPGIEARVAAPTVTSTTPGRIALGPQPQRVVVSGSGFTPDGAQGLPTVTIGGVALRLVAGEPVSPMALTVEVPAADAARAAGLVAGTHEVIVVTAPTGMPSAAGVSLVVGALIRSAVS